MTFAHRLDDSADLVLLDLRYAEELFALIDANREHLRPWMPWVDQQTSPETSSGFIREMLFKLAGGTDLLAGVRHEGRLAGAIGLHHINTHTGTAEIGYWLGAEFEGKGLMTKACVAMLDYAFDDLGLNRVQIRVEPANNRSRGIPRRLGFHYEGTLRQVGRIQERFLDLEVYSMLKSEWESRIERTE
jgi:ribosomal-protein-serine acetyltransferase